ncbi:hypothetical protein [Pseudomonas sp. UFMG81]|uniref:hypothetical protein n=1 Tax=Pseudomonas sp. UFMG81 TaxID=2745936 RepID=UPI00189037A1|nr:hypothetical protein [Pseudomonas sp. UFMG81]
MRIYYSNEENFDTSSWFVVVEHGQGVHSCRHHMGGGSGAQYLKLSEVPSGCSIGFIQTDDEGEYLNTANVVTTHFSTTTGVIDFTSLMTSPNYEVAAGLRKTGRHYTSSASKFTHISWDWDPSWQVRDGSDRSDESTLHGSPARSGFDQLALYPDALSRVSDKDQAQFMADPRLIPVAKRLWTCTAGQISEDGLYTANGQHDGTSRVTCTLVHNDVIYVEAHATLSHAPAAIAPQGYWTRLTNTKVEVSEFGNLRPVRAFMYGNGAQQLIVDIEATTDKGELPDEEWAKLRFFDYRSHQQTQVLPPSAAPVLHGAHWACTTDRNKDYDTAKISPSGATDTAIPNTAKRFYLHSRAPQTTTKKFYAGFCDALGWWHYFTQSKNAFEVAILDFSAPRLTLTAGARGGFDDTSEFYPYDMNLDTYEYFILASDPSAPFKDCSVKGKNEAGQWVPRNSIVRFERDAPIEEFCSVTAIVLKPEELTDKLVVFDDELTKMGLFNSKLDHTFDGDLKEHQVMISVHRFSDIPLYKASDVERNKILRHYSSDLRFEFHDHYGNAFSKIIGFIPKKQARHRDQLI